MISIKNLSKSLTRITLKITFEILKIQKNFLLDNFGCSSPPSGFNGSIEIGEENDGESW